MEHVQQKQASHNAWLRKTAGEAELEIEEEWLYDENPDKKLRAQAERQKLQEELDALLKKKINVATAIHSLRYPTLHHDQQLVSALTRSRQKITKITN